MKYGTEKIWEDFSGKLRTFIRSRVSNPSHVDDILQDVFIKIHERIDTLREDAKIQGWIFAIARNTIIDYYRKRKIIFEDIDAVSLTDHGALDAVDEAIYENPSREIASGLRGMVEALPEKYARALLLVEFDGLSQTGLARRMGISVSAVKSRVQRGRRMLKDALMQCCHFEFDRYGTVVDVRPVSCCCCRPS
jgi:RNA polymerase sigma-70 factor (ECF subfamily)